MRVFAETRCALWTLGVAVLALACPGFAADGRPSMSLDGQWQFQLDPQQKGAAEHWEAADARFEATIRVPGAWDAQGFGAETDKFRHNFVGQAWYKRDIIVPPEWAGRRVFLCIGGVHRYADVWANGRHLGEHIGYLSPLEFELTPQVQPGRPVTIAIRVDSEQRWDIDCLQGCFDVIDEMFANWGGIWDHVRLEARAGAWLENLHVRSRLSPRGCTVSAKLVGDPAACDRVKLEIAGAVKTLSLDQAAGKDATISVDIDLPDAPFWSPEDPQLHTAALTLLKGDQVIDRVATRFGLREIRTDGYRFLLNGRRAYLRGYGDDAIYPETMAAPCDKEYYRTRLHTIKGYGFNFVRHHSHMLPTEYYDAADEVGMLVSAEFPIAYQNYYRRAKGKALDLYRSEWAAAITRWRNHPSIFDWAMSNELWGSFPLAKELYAAAKALDPDRLVIDSDGLHLATLVNGKGDRSTIDFYTVQFNKDVIPLDNPRKYATPETVKKPALCHETGNFITFPRLAAIERFTHNFKPFWLTPIRERLGQLGLLEEAPLWSRNSERLYLLCHKLNTEALRKEPKMSGYTWWLFQDYWTGSNGLVDAYFQPKEIRPEEVLAFNNDVVLLLDGLDVTGRSGQRVELKLLVSNYATDVLTDASAEWGGKAGDQTAFEWTGTAARLEQGEVSTLRTLAIELPAVTVPTKLLVTSALKVAGRSWSNEWSAWVYPANPEPPKLAAPLVAAADVIDVLARYHPQALSAKAAWPEHAVCVAGQPTRPMLEAVAAGAHLLLLEPAPLFPAASNRFKTAWWLGTTNDANAGTVVYDHAPVKAIAPEGWCDAGWYHVLEGSQVAPLDDLPAAPDVLIRGIDVARHYRSKALLFQARVGKGCIIVSGLNLGLGHADNRPEREWLLDRLIEYASTRPEPKSELPLAWLRSRLDESALPEGPIVNGFAGTPVEKGEEVEHVDHRGVSGPMYVCRQTAPEKRVEWPTAALPADLGSETVTFRFAGGLGWRSEPPTKGFAVLVDGQEVLAFDAAAERRTWRAADGGAQLLFVPRYLDDEDALGLFYLTLPAGMVKAGTPCRLAVVSKGAGSRRWFGLTP